MCTCLNCAACMLHFLGWLLHASTNFLSTTRGRCRSASASEHGTPVIPQHFANAWPRGAGEGGGGRYHFWLLLCLNWCMAVCPVLPDTIPTPHASTNVYLTLHPCLGLCLCLRLRLSVHLGLDIWFHQRPTLLHACRFKITWMANGCLQ